MKTNPNEQISLSIGDRIAERLERHYQVMPTLTLADAAKALGLSGETMRRLCQSGQIAYIKTDRLYRIRPIDINRYLERHYHQVEEDEE